MNELGSAKKNYHSLFKTEQQSRAISVQSLCNVLKLRDKMEMSKKRKSQNLEKDLNSVLKMTCEGLEPPIPTLSKLFHSFPLVLYHSKEYGYVWVYYTFHQ